VIAPGKNNDVLPAPAHGPEPAEFFKGRLRKLAHFFPFFRLQGNSKKHTRRRGGA
jgi:hypothetical protein